MKNNSYELKDWLNSINQSKFNMMEEDIDSEKTILHILSIDVYLVLLILSCIQMR